MMVFPFPMARSAKLFSPIVPLLAAIGKVLTSKCVLFRATDPADQKGRLFQTGDLGRRRPDGLIEFLGRKDQYIKLHGHRIDPAEIESVLRTIPEVRDTAVIVRKSESGDPR